jgi:hypothetical protein
VIHLCLPLVSVGDLLPSAILLDDEVIVDQGRHVIPGPGRPREPGRPPPGGEFWGKRTAPDVWRKR